MWKYKKFNKAARIIISIICAVVLLGSMGKNKDEGNVNQDTQEQSSSNKSSKKSSEKYPEFISSDFEKRLYDTIESNKAKLSDIGYEVNEAGETMLTIACRNDEDAVNSVIKAIAPIVAENGNSILIRVNENGSGDKLLAHVRIFDNGTYETIGETKDYRTAYKKWVGNYISPLNGECTDLSDQIKRNLNDQKSFEHINTSIYKGTTPEAVDEANERLAQWGYDKCFESNDVLIITEFSNKNSYNATVRNQAIGRLSYADNKVYLIDIRPLV